ncbi:hypothetical protein AYI70_g12120 [Smittium culicis]|uniref:Uncharacterized protein n=1 Tax=Smittium culicis TaxID=133412 RepID=A0A1R1WYR4_9FUNG|nr:hypothetical protein AYI70_g12120 [Smittium culicis]
MRPTSWLSDCEPSMMRMCAIPISRRKLSLVDCRVSHAVQLGDASSSRTEPALAAVSDDHGNRLWVRHVADLVHIVRIYQARREVRCLQVVDRLPHIAVRSERQRLDAFGHVPGPLARCDLHQLADHLLVVQLRKLKQRAPTLDRLDDL